MKTLDGIEITYEMSYDLLESLRNRFKEGSTALATISFCQDIISDGRLGSYPDIEFTRNNKIILNYEELDINHLSIKINPFGIDFDDKVISYFYIKGDKTESKSDVTWNEVIEIIKYWHSIN